MFDAEIAKLNFALEKKKLFKSFKNLKSFEWGWRGCWTAIKFSTKLFFLENGLNHVC